MQQLTFRAQLKILNNIEIPFRLDTRFGDPRLASDFLHNRFNQFGVSPRLFGWLQLHGGYFSRPLSELTLGGSRLLGGGAEVQIGPAQMIGFYGLLRKGNNDNRLNGAGGEYRRTAYGGRIGIGREGAFHVHLNAVHIIDDTATTSRLMMAEPPKENALVSIAFGLPFAERQLVISGEAALAAFTNDLGSNIIASVRIPKQVFVPRYSSQIDGAMRFALQYRLQKLQLLFNGRWIGPGFVSLGQPYQGNDIVEGTIAPRVGLLDDKLTLQASVGVRRNNLRKNRTSAMTRLTSSVVTSASVTEWFSVDCEYASHGLRHERQNDSLRFNDLTQSFSLSPRMSISALGGMNNLAIFYSHQQYKDESVMLSADYQSHSTMATWSLVLPSSLTFTTTFTNNLNKTSESLVVMNSVGESVGFQFLDNRISMLLSFSYYTVKALSKDQNLAFSLATFLSLHSLGTISFNLSNTSYSYGPGSTALPFSEFRGTAQYEITF